MANPFEIVAPEELIRGQAVSVPIALNLTKRLKIRGIQAVFRGVEETEATYTTHTGKTTQTHTATQQVELFRQCFQLAGRAAPGFLAGLGEAVDTVAGTVEHPE